MLNKTIVWNHHHTNSLVLVHISIYELLVKSKSEEIRVISGAIFRAILNNVKIQKLGFSIRERELAIISKIRKNFPYQENDDDWLETFEYFLGELSENHSANGW